MSSSEFWVYRLRSTERRNSIILFSFALHFFKDDIYTLLISQVFKENACCFQNQCYFKNREVGACYKVLLLFFQRYRFTLGISSQISCALESLGKHVIDGYWATPMRVWYSSFGVGQASGFLISFQNDFWGMPWFHHLGSEVWVWGGEGVQDSSHLDLKMCISEQWCNVDPVFSPHFVQRRWKRNISIWRLCFICIRWDSELLDGLWC